MIGSLRISTEDLNQLERPEVKEEIGRIVLGDIGKSELYGLQDLQDVKVFFVDTRDGQRVVILLDLGLENNLVAIYTEDGNVYEYVAELDLFYQINDIKFLPIASQNKNAIIVNEYINQGLGAYEFSERLTGYVLENDAYRQVLNLEGDTSSYWNELWDHTKESQTNLWELVEQNIVSQWGEDEKGNPILYLVKEQSYSQAKGNDENTVPLEDEFEKISERTIKEVYRWSDDWGRFILGEAIEKSSQELVAIVEIRDNSPYALAGFVDNTFLILDENEDVRMVDGSDLLQIKKSE